MPTTAIELPVPAGPRRKRWTREEYDQLSSSGVLDEQILELVDGELIDNMARTAVR
jgi:hypothetical protein